MQSELAYNSNLALWSSVFPPGTNYFSMPTSKNKSTILIEIVSDFTSSLNKRIAKLVCKAFQIFLPYIILRKIFHPGTDGSISESVRPPPTNDLTQQSFISPASSVSYDAILVSGR